MNKENPETTKCPGGPQTCEGKTTCSRNAIRHGLSAKKLLVEVLDRELVEQRRQSLSEEWGPQTPTERYLILEMARHQAALERIEQMEFAVLQAGAHFAPDTLADGSDEVIGDDDRYDEMMDAMLAVSATSEGVEKISRYRRQHERGFLRSLDTLQAARAMRAGPNRSCGTQWAFSTEEQCCDYLVRFFEAHGIGCTRCSSKNGRQVGSRHVWQCRTCRKQIGIRTGTIMATSRLPLTAWFQMIELLIGNPNVSTAELMAQTGICREGTVRKMAGEIRQAVNTPDARRLLAGLDHVFGEGSQDTLR